MNDVSRTPSRPPHEPEPSFSAPRAGALLVFLFQGVGKRQYALSADPEGRNLPHGDFGVGAWTFVRVVHLLDGEVRLGFDAQEAVRAIREDGYALIGFPFHLD